MPATPNCNPSSQREMRVALKMGRLYLTFLSVFCCVFVYFVCIAVVRLCSVQYEKNKRV